MTDATPPANPDERHIDTQIEIDAPVDAVWRALTEAEGLMNWFPPKAEVKPGVGGSIRSVWNEQQDWTAGIGAWDPNKHLQVIWAEATPPEKIEEAKKAGFYSPLRIAVDHYLNARDGGGTVLRLVQTGFSTDSAWDNQYDGTVRGWAYQLRGLKHYLEHHADSTRVVVDAKKVLDGIPLAEAWNRLMSADGLLAVGNAGDLRVGDRYSFTTTAGDTFDGEVRIMNPPRDFCGTIDNLNDAFIRLAVDEGCMSQPQDEVNIFISTYGLPRTQTDGLQQRLRSMLDQLYAAAPAH
jgi:uncharacterized protein YndB with AHSA1/START domain